MVSLAEYVEAGRKIIAAAEADGITIGGEDGWSPVDLLVDNFQEDLSLGFIADVLEQIDGTKYARNIARVRRWGASLGGAA